MVFDVSGAFDDISHVRLLDNLHKRRVDEKIVKWIASLLSNIYTSTTIDGTGKLISKV